MQIGELLVGLGLTIDLMDPAFLRHIPYKIELRAPTRSEYQEIFRAVASSCGRVVTPAVFDFIVERLERHIGLAHYQPKFICQQVVDAARAFGCVPELTKKTAMAALCNLYYDIEPPGSDDGRCTEAQLISFAQSA